MTTDKDGGNGMTAYKLRCHKCDDADYPGASELAEHLWAEHGDLLETTAEDEDTPWDAISQLRGADVMSDALLFSADAEIERLKCCGNCFHSSSAICCEPQLLETDGDNYVETNGGRNVCRFAPSRWTERSTP